MTTTTIVAVAVEGFRPDLGEDRMPSPENGNAFASIPQVETGNVLPANHEIVKRYPASFVKVPDNLHPDVLSEVVALTREYRHTNARAEQTGPETCSQCGTTNTRVHDELTARASDLRETLVAHGIEVA